MVCSSWTLLGHAMDTVDTAAVKLRMSLRSCRDGINHLRHSAMTVAGGWCSHWCAKPQVSIRNRALEMNLWMLNWCFNEFLCYLCLHLLRYPHPGDIHKRPSGNSWRECPHKALLAQMAELKLIWSARTSTCQADTIAESGETVEQFKTFRGRTSKCRIRLVSVYEPL